MPTPSSELQAACSPRCLHGRQLASLPALVKDRHTLLNSLSLISPSLSCSLQADTKPLPLPRTTLLLELHHRRPLSHSHPDKAVLAPSSPPPLSYAGLPTAPLPSPCRCCTSCPVAMAAHGSFMAMPPVASSDRHSASRGCGLPQRPSSAIAGHPGCLNQSHDFLL